MDDNGDLCPLALRGGVEGGILVLGREVEGASMEEEEEEEGPGVLLCS